jgi:hypothetical protein
MIAVLKGAENPWPISSQIHNVVCRAKYAFHKVVKDRGKTTGICKALI